MINEAFFRRSALIFAAALGFQGGGSLTGQTIPVSGDAHVNSAYSSVNFGSSPYLSVGGGTRAYLQFDLSSLPPAVAVSGVTKVILVMWVGKVTTGGTIQVSLAGGTWNESTITSATQPEETGGQVGTATVPAVPDFVYIDVTASFTNWVANPESNQGFVVDGLGSAMVYLDSKESVTTSHVAVLNVELPGPAGATGAVGPVGPAGPAGPAGAMGLAGPAGLAGAAGAMGPPGPAGTALNWRGAWSSELTYAINDAVASGGSAWVSLMPGNFNNQPAMYSGFWSLMAQQGATGDVGPAGAVGPTGPAGPTGAIGPTGPAGPQGPAGSPSNTSYEYHAQFLGTQTQIFYYAPEGSSTALGDSALTFSDQIVAPLSCTMSQLSVGAFVETASGSTVNNATVTVFRNGSPQTMACTAAVTNAANGSGSCDDTTHTFSVNAGDLLTLQLNASNTAPTVLYATLLRCR